MSPCCTWHDFGWRWPDAILTEFPTSWGSHVLAGRDRRRRIRTEKGTLAIDKSLEIYLQEVAVATYDKKLSQVTKSRISGLCKHFSNILEKAIFLKTSKIPETVWAQLW